MPGYGDPNRDGGPELPHSPERHPGQRDTTPEPHRHYTPEPAPSPAAPSPFMPAPIMPAPPQVAHAPPGPPEAHGDETIGFDVEHIEERGSPKLLRGKWRAFEVWTENRIYELDASLECVEVVNRATNASDPGHALLGARLVGGQVRRAGGQIAEVSHPLPRVGGLAVFERRTGQRISFAETSPVTRVVMRVRVVTLSPRDPAPEWQRLTGHHRSR